jgi:hypothetical protein
MGASRPVTARRAGSLAVVVVAAIGILTGLSHIGHSTISNCTGTWWVVVGHPTDQASAATDNSRAGALVPTTCAGSAPDGKGGFFAYALFRSEADASAYSDALTAAGYARTWGFTPVVQPQPVVRPTTTPTG